MHPSSTIAQPRRWPNQAQRLLAPCRDADEALAQLVTVGRHRRPVDSRSRPQAAAPCDSKSLSEPCPTEAFRGAGEGGYRSPPVWPAGPVAQWLEPAAHNRLVAGSSPAGPTKSRQAPGGSRGAERPPGAPRISGGTQSESAPVQPQALSALMLVDAKPGHYHQSEGVVAAIGRMRAVTSHRLEVRRRFFLPTRILVQLVNRGVSPGVILRLGYGIDAASLPNAHLVLPPA